MRSHLSSWKDKLRRKSSSQCKPTAEQIAASMALKELGNEHFKAGQYKEAEELYSQAITQNSTDPKLFSNRATTRIRLQNYPGAESDSRKALELFGPSTTHPTAMKAYYNLAQSLLSQRHPQEALETALHAYRICLEIKDSSAEVLSQFILRTKQAQWAARETDRLRELNETLAVVETLLEQQLERDLVELEARFSRGEIGTTGREEETVQLRSEAKGRRRNVREAMRDPEREETAERIVPDYLIDNITFEIMHDPVITPSGMSFERVGLLRHLKVAGVDPITREVLGVGQLVTNVGLKNACADFLERNGWAVDY